MDTKTKKPTVFILHDQDGHPFAACGLEIGKVWPVAQTLEDALKLAMFFTTCNDRRASPISVAQITGRQLQECIDAALEEGCVAAVAPTAWNADGSPELSSLACYQEWYEEYQAA